MSHVCTLNEIRSGLDRKVFSPRVLSVGQRGVVTGIMDSVCGSEKARKIVLSWCFPNHFDGSQWEDVTSEALTIREWDALWRWISPSKVGREWGYRAGLEAECAEILFAQMRKMKTNEMTIGMIQDGFLFPSGV